MRLLHTRQDAKKDRPGRTGNRNLDLLKSCGCKSDAMSCQELVSEQRWHTNFYQLRECKLMVVNRSRVFLPELFARSWSIFPNNVIYPLYL